MAGENNNQQNNNGGENNNQQQSNNQQNNQTQQQSNNQQTQQVDANKVREDAMAELFKGLGVDNEDALKAIVTKHNERENANKSELEKVQGTLTATTKELATERSARLLAEAKLSAIKLGAKPELVDDLVTVAMARVTKDKNIDAVMAEIKDGTTGSIYFISKDEQEEGKNKNITNKRTSNNQQNNQQQQNQNNQQNNGSNNQQNNTNENHSGSIAERLMSKRKVAKPNYFK